MRKLKFSVFAIFAVVVLFFTACKPYQEQVYVEIKPNETAFVVPMEQNTKAGQEKLKSLEYLEKNKVASKRIYIPTAWHQTGRARWSGKYIPTVKVIVVDRTPVTREWVQGAKKGTGTKDEEITVESSNSIAFRLGITCTASIPEEDAAKFQYWYGGKTLENVMDENVRSYIQDLLTAEFGKRVLLACQNQRTDVYTIMKNTTIEWFGSRGIRIDNIGVAGDWTYVNPEIQTAINLEFIAEKKDAAANKEVSAANKFIGAAEAIKAQKRLDAEINLTNSLAEAIKAGKFRVPTTLVMSPGMSMMDIYGIKNLSK